MNLFEPIIDTKIVPEKTLKKPLATTSTANHSAKSKISISTPNIEKTNQDQPAEELDLIQFFDTKIFEMGNLVFGQDISVIRMDEPHSSSNKKTGVDVFQEEAAKGTERSALKTLEERLAHLESSIKNIKRKASNSPFQEVQQSQSNGSSVFIHKLKNINWLTHTLFSAEVISQHTGLLEQAKREISILEGKVESLEATYRTTWIFLTPR
ncbi:uncharacterized protein MELLADRAFT_63662 [Melampsora larici-populina 98AG31]|uniref:Uncharacterized protein n=1 Tax=Melampsora larici-populina (strain 98AG31 / pathotype 3-4-7) TaxID=747676 RepID=F4RNI3_MELLP|nr:uncharacterized protein MELLADRAFT_63662 [Melampsora larici-populina 98AG31]EGG06091.1 hypothetical protein MELLADRAFT_63662 [Melampsora larici-populina 98AG31]